MTTFMLWLLSALALAAAQDPSQYSGGIQFLPAPDQPLYSGYPGAPGVDPFLGAPTGAAGGFPSDPRTGPLTFGPEHARPATTTPNPFRQGPLVQAALQQQRLLQQLQQQQQAFAAAPSPSGRYASLPQPPAPAPAGPTGFAGYGGFAPLAPSAPAAPYGLLPAPQTQDEASSYAYNQ